MAKTLFRQTAQFSFVVFAVTTMSWLLHTRSNWAKEEDAPSDAAKKAAKTDEDYELLKLFVDTLDQVERNYVKDISRRELVEAAIQGMVAKLDQHTNYISRNELDQFKTGVESEFGGIGIHVNAARGELQIVAPVVGSPAYRAGLVMGDVITHVEGKVLRGMPGDEATKLLKGKAGTSVEFTVLRRKDNKSETMKLTREVVRVDSILGHQRNADNSWKFWCDEEQKLGYVRMTGFARHTAEDLRKVLEDLQKAGMKGFVLDLRFNPGGLLSSAIEVSDLFLAEGRIVSTAGRNVEEKKWDAQRRGTFEGFPMAVLVNRGSASASEIVAACLQDHQRAVVIGERTWGKGSVQNVVELEGGQSAIKLTTAKYYRPSGKDIHRDENEEEKDEWGVKPNDGFAELLSRTEVLELDQSLAQRWKLNDPDSPPVEITFVDRQLQKAIGYLQEQLAKSAPEKKPAAK